MKDSWLSKGYPRDIQGTCSWLFPCSDNTVEIQLMKFLNFTSWQMESYEILNRIGKGGQGTTLRVIPAVPYILLSEKLKITRSFDKVKQRHSGNIFVLKQSFCDRVATGNLALKEAKTLQLLSHPNVVRYARVLVACNTCTLTQLADHMSRPGTSTCFWVKMASSWLCAWSWSTVTRATWPTICSL